MVRKYVAGLLFNTNGTRVAVILKKRPAWQAGRYNAIGGLIEAFETPQTAMEREFREETGFSVDCWRKFCVLRGKTEINYTTDFGAEHVHKCDAWDVHFFCAFVPLGWMTSRLQTMTDEEVGIKLVSELNSGNSIPNLPWLIAMARNMDQDLNAPVSMYVVNETYETKEKTEELRSAS